MRLSVIIYHFGRKLQEKPLNNNLINALYFEDFEILRIRYKFSMREID